ncbi:MAG: riboflavin kinase [Patescibacteria group bacterium]
MLIRGLVVEGFKQGRLLGYPTANLQLLANIKRPSSGIYACLVKRADGSKYLGILISGVHKEKDGQLRLEVYLLNWQGSLYGEILRVQVFNRLRDIIVTKNQEQLKKIIQSDIKAVEEFFKSARKFF